ncbi:MAG: hypothetical protein AAF514_07860 [Verrucomicrobiota bacterium]
MGPDHPHLFWWVVGALFLFLLLISLTARLWWARFSRERRSRRRTREALKGEQKAEKLLRKNGFRILDRQVRRQGRIRIDGQWTLFEVRADYLVRKGFRRFVAEVKTGGLAPDPQHPPTRRQLLEYSLVFRVRGVLLVDMEAGQIRRVDFRSLL